MTLKHKKVKKEVSDGKDEDDYKVHNLARTSTRKIESSDEGMSRIESDKDASSNGRNHNLKEKALSWSREADLMLVDLRDKQKLPWKEVTSHFPHRTTSACQQRHMLAQRNVTANQDLNKQDKKSVYAVFKKRKMAIYKQVADEINKGKTCSQDITWRTAESTVEERIKKGK